MKDMKDKHI